VAAWVRAAEGVGAQFGAGTLFADAFGFSDRAEGGAGVDGGAGGVGDASAGLLELGWMFATVGAEAVGGGGGDRLQIGRQRLLALAGGHAGSPLVSVRQWMMLGVQGEQLHGFGWRAVTQPAQPHSAR
jgi:hypothetical protein